MPAGDDLRADLRAVMQQGVAAQITDDEFNQLALRAFRHQFNLNKPYQRYCERRGRTPANTGSWQEVPPVPTAAFKEVPLIAGSVIEAALTFQTSGTTRGRERRGRHHIMDATLYEESLQATFRGFVLPDHERITILSLMPSHTELPDSSLSYMITSVLQAFGDAASDVYAKVTNGLDSARLNETLQQADQPVCLLGTSLAFWHWLESDEAKFDLPAGSRLMDTGGFKGEQRSVSAEELRSRYQSQLSIPEHHCINEYGMTELCSQYYDVALRMSANQNTGVKAGPPWLRARVVDPETLAELPSGQTGILQHFDLANLNSVCAVVTEDLAVATSDGFVLHGRVPGATPRGCSIAMDMLLQDGSTA